MEAESSIGYPMSLLIHWRRYNRPCRAIKVQPDSQLKCSRMTHPIYRPYSREKNQALIKSLVNPQGQNAMENACRFHHRDFSPSLYAELDWQRFRPDLVDPNLKQILDLIHGLLFVVGFPLNMHARDQGKGTIRLDSLEESRLVPIFEAWLEVWMMPEGQSVLASFDNYVASLRTPPRREQEVNLRENSLKRLDQALGENTDPSNLAKTVNQILLNAQYAFLDIPWTRQAVRASLLVPDSPVSLGSIIPYELDSGLDPNAIAKHLLKCANTVDAPGGEEWVALLRGAAERIDGLDLSLLTGDGGDWTEGRAYCGQCAMWFAVRTVAVMDDRGSFAQDAYRNIIYIPPDAMVCSCPFCGFASPTSVPTIFFSERRDQVIYLVPTRDGISKSEAISFWEPLIQETQSRYLNRRGDALSEKFWAAAELVTHNLPEFFYAIQMGDTVAEDHVFNTIGLECGSMLVYDGQKRFARVLTPGEAKVFRANSRVREGLPEIAAHLAKGGRAGRVLRLEDVEEFLELFADLNEEIDADLAKAQQERGRGVLDD